MTAGFLAVGALLLSRAEPRDAAPLFAAPLRAQSGNTLMPAESAAKARQLIDAAIAARGGSAYLGVRDVTCEGRVAQIGRGEELTGFARFIDYTKLPDKSRTEFFKKRNIISVNNGNQGWELDRGGVVDATPDAVQHFLESLKKDIDQLFRLRLKEEGMSFRYAGTGIVDLKQVDWVEVVDSGRRTTRIAFDPATHLPLRAEYITRDPVTRQRSVEVEYFANFHVMQGVLTPMQSTRERDGARVMQLFLDSCKYNTGLDDALFTRESLGHRWAELDKGKKKK